MKISANVLVTGGLFAAAGLLGAQDATPDSTVNHGDPYLPVGTMKVTPEVVQPGVQPEVTWGIEYPKSIPDLVHIDSNGGMTTLNDQSDKINIRVAGVSFASGDTDLPVALWVRVDNGSWNLIFYGTESEVSGDVVFSQTIHDGTRVDLAARGRTSDGGWSETQWTLSSSPNVEALVHGDELPSNSSDFSNGQVEDFMSQYVDSTVTEVVAGPRDIIHVFEVGSSDPGDSYFDMQDIVVVTTFGRNNNGHGNNEDGFDSSNQGNSTGVGGVGDTNMLDGVYIDDEKKHIKRKTTTVTETTTVTTTEEGTTTETTTTTTTN